MSINASLFQLSGRLHKKVSCLPVVFFALLSFCSCTLFANALFASQLSSAEQLIKAGKLEQAAAIFAQHKSKKRAAYALAMTGRLLDRLQDDFSERYERKCYWKKSAPRTPNCMRKGAKELNAKFGKGAFEYTGGVSVAYIQYTGSHYKKIAKRYRKSKYAAEADFYLLLTNLRGQPNEVSARVKSFMDEHRSGKWHRKSLLLWARLNEDVSYVWRKWTWVVFNGVISDEELIIKSEPYRLAAVEAFEELINKYPGTYEAKTAAVELKQLKQQGGDKALYSITNDSTALPWSRWGVEVK